MFGYKFISETEHEELLEEVAMLRSKLANLSTDENGTPITESLFVDLQQLHPVAIERRPTCSVVHINGGATCLYLQCSLKQHEQLVAEATKHLTAPAYQVLGKVAERAVLFDAH